MKNKKEYIIPCKWECYGRYRVYANSKEEAIEQANELSLSEVPYEESIDNFKIISNQIEER